MNDLKVYRFIYKIICLKGGSKWKDKYYIGQHTTTCLDDGYAGSGVKIWEYYRTYGKKLNETYKLDILKDNIDNQTELDKWEIKYIERHLSDKKCLNIDKGGKIDRDNKKKANDYYINEEEKYIPCYKDTTLETTSKYKFDAKTDSLLEQLKEDPYNWELRKQCIDRLLRYGTTVSLLNI